MKHVVMQAIGHYRVPCDWPKKTKKTRRDRKFSSHEVAHEITAHRTKLKQELSIFGDQ